jgi:hypothetical protein
MVGMGTLLFLLSAWYGVCWLFRRRMPKSRLFLILSSGAGIAAVITMEAGWVVSEVGQIPFFHFNRSSSLGFVVSPGYKIIILLPSHKVKRFL